MRQAWLISGVRTPIGKFLGSLRELPATELGARVVAEALTRADADPADVDEVILGNVVSAGLGQAPARQAALNAGIPSEVPAVTVNKVCGSGLKAVIMAAQAIRLGDADLVVAGGMESMTRAPHLLHRGRDGWKLGENPLQDAVLTDGLWCAFDNCHMGSHAEWTARRFDIGREDQDEYALESHRRAVQAAADGAFDDELTEVVISGRKGEVRVIADETPRPDSRIESLARLLPAFDSDGTVTAGNASALSDGAAALVVTHEERAMQAPFGLRARIVAYAASGTQPHELFIAPVLAVRRVLERAGLGPDDIDLYEINEAFAAQMLACIRELQLDPARVNVHGGAIALGHPIGASGARVLVTLLAALKRHGLRRGLASLCLGGGNAVAMIIERD